MNFTEHIFRIKIFFLLIVAAGIFSLCSFGASKKPFIIVIDAGHGGKDVGAVDNGVREKDINLGVALQLGDILKKKMKDVKVVYTRDDDTYLTLQQRADKANGAKGNLFISIHTNSLDANNPKRKTVEGSSVYVLGLHKDDSNMKVAQRENAVIKLEENYNEKYEGFDPQRDESYIIFEMAQKKNLSNSIKFAEIAEKQLQSTAGRKGRGVHQAGFWVLWATSMPGALVEVDFICNPKSAEFISSTAGQKKLAEALFKSVETYRKELKLAEKQTPKLENRVEAKGEAVTLAESKGTTRIVTDAPKVRASSNGKSPRRRRSDAARKVSISHNYETDFITINTHSDQSVSDGLVSETNIAANPPVINDVEDVKKPRNRKDRKLKAKKEKINKHKNNDSQVVRIVNGREVVINEGGDANHRKSAKENSAKAQGKSRARTKDSIAQGNKQTDFGSNSKDASKKKIVNKEKGNAETADMSAVNASQRNKNETKSDTVITASDSGKKSSKDKKLQQHKEIEQANGRVEHAFSNTEQKIQINEANPESSLNKKSRNRHSNIK
ncbi:MAG: N-acetylmuramoyl-L-alanine amidase [Prevotella sp.]|nr:N-acetylmuramoyl-L-alanine amidase [Bacteroides sp.]MCM1365901.1 N-acetylmuramoyl-L-alanine amidase [Prevotella sp.]